MLLYWYSFGFDRIDTILWRDRIHRATLFLLLLIVDCFIHSLHYADLMCLSIFVINDCYSSYYCYLNVNDYDYCSISITYYSIEISITYYSFYFTIGTTSMWVHAITTNTMTFYYLYFMNILSNDIANVSCSNCTTT